MTIFFYKTFILKLLFTEILLNRSRYLLWVKLLFLKVLKYILGNIKIEFY